MKTSLLAFILLTCALGAQAVQLTFRVDMHGRAISVAGVHIAGNFQSEAGFAGDWDPATTAMTDANADSVYELTVDIPGGTYLYKFINGTAWPTSEIVPGSCGQTDGGGNVNRQVILGTAPLILTTVPFGDCPTTVRFAVNMRGQAISPNGVHVEGNFQRLAGFPADWDPGIVEMTDVNGDSTYEAEVTLPAQGRFLYRYVNGNLPSDVEAVPAACGMDDGNGSLARVADVMSAVTILPANCYGTCTVCGDSLGQYATYWWNDAIFYEVFVRSFYDNNGNGKGDLAGLTAKLDYLNDGNPATTTDLGITAIWLMPIMLSPSYHGYDISDYKTVQTDYGSMADFDAFMAAAHARGIKVILDLVLNHTASTHRWFRSSASAPGNTFRDWYVWRNNSLGPDPNNRQVWYLRGSQYYYAYFGGGFPDLNWRNADMRAAMYDVSRFWLEKGVDGYRLDAVKFLVEDSTALENRPGTLSVLEEFHDSLAAVKPDVFTVGEAWSPTPQVVPYVVHKRLSTCFEFFTGFALISALQSGSAASFLSQLNTVNNAYPKLQYSVFLTNHDQDRIMDQLNGNMARMKQAAALYLTMPGVPFMYYGEEIGMAGSTGGDQYKRKPMQWTAGTHGGFTTGTPWEALSTDIATVNVETQQADPASLLNHYKKLIALRMANEPLRKGYYLPLTSTNTHIASFGRVYRHEAILTVANLSTSSITNAGLAASISSLPAGTYFVTDLYSGLDGGTVVVDANGGFATWTPTLPPLGGNQTWMLHLSQTPNAVAQAENRLGLKVYPNPASTQLRIEVDQAVIGSGQIAVYDLQGRLLDTMPFTGKGRNLNTAGWPTGSYFVRVQADKAVSVQHVVISR